ncbi:hypothetical protein [Lyticum sinuosum]|uniref:NlpC/P60 domain-containing protein n=1 Tax=Lyticum sinuosum TaxID=1332059 RepID=A0AAE5AHZ2_9RICK|nr:hypothetical protein [Lyticum sinuosum]MDZ5761581.1 hypothetical protein [Lyticum sinuosum]
MLNYNFSYKNFKYTHLNNIFQDDTIQCHVNTYSKKNEILYNKNTNNNYTNYTKFKSYNLITSEKIINSARSFIGHSFRPQGRGINGYDCIGLILAIAKDLNIVSVYDKISNLNDFDNLYYDINIDSFKLIEVILKHFIIKYIDFNKLNISDNEYEKYRINDISQNICLEIGDIVLLKLGWRNWHIGIVSEIESGNISKLIHACINSGFIVEEKNHKFNKNIAALCKFWNIFSNKKQAI